MDTAANKYAKLHTSIYKAVFKYTSIKFFCRILNVYNKTQVCAKGNRNAIAFSPEQGM